MIKSFLPSLNLPYSPEQIEQLKEELYSYAKGIRTKELDLHPVFWSNKNRDIILKADSL